MSRMTDSALIMLYAKDRVLQVYRFGVLYFDKSTWDQAVEAVLTQIQPSDIHRIRDKYLHC